MIVVEHSAVKGRLRVPQLGTFVSVVIVLLTRVRQCAVPMNYRKSARQHSEVLVYVRSVDVLRLVVLLDFLPRPPVQRLDITCPPLRVEHIV